jgi:hypothetical protein
MDGSEVEVGGVWARTNRRGKYCKLVFAATRRGWDWALPGPPGHCWQPVARAVPLLAPRSPPGAAGCRLLALRAQSRMDTFMGSVGVKGHDHNSDWRDGGILQAEQRRGCLLRSALYIKEGVGVNTVSPL